MNETPQRRFDDSPENFTTRFILLEQDHKRLSEVVEKLAKVVESDRQEVRELTFAMKQMNKVLHDNTQVTTKLQRTMIWLNGALIGGVFIIGLLWTVVTTLMGK